MNPSSFSYGSGGALSDAQVEAVAIDWVARRDAGLNAAEERELNGWLAADKRHGRAFERFDTSWASLDHPRHAGKAGVILHVLSRRARVRRRRRLAWSGVAGLVLVSTIFLGPSLGRRLDRAPLPASHVAVSPMNQRLADGSRVEFNEGAEISVDFSVESRNVHLLKGEAHFEVARDASRPFVVTAGHVRVRAVGTAFAVRLDPAGVEVLVTEGRVTVDDGASRDGTEPPAEVAAGYKVVVPVVGDEEKVAVAPMTDLDFGARLAWRGLRLEFSGTPLREAIMRFNTRNRVQLVVSDPSIEDLRVSGIFRAENVEGFVRLMEGSFGMEVSRRTEQEIVLGAAAGMKPQ